jgi:hypothetical protein
MIYLAKYNNVNKLISYEYVCDSLSIIIINTILSEKELPRINSSDIQLLRSAGGTLVYRTTEEDFLWLVDLNHISSPTIEKIIGNELLKKISDIINSINRDIKINRILKTE